MRFNKTNQLTVSGRVGNVSLQQGNSGPYGSLSIAVDTGYKGRDGNWVDDTSWVTVEFGGNTGSFVADKGVGKGDLLVVEGSLFESKWKDKESGADRSALKVRADRIAEHVPSVVFECLKANGFFGNQQARQAPTNQQQPANQQRQQAAAPTGRNGNGYQPRQNGGGQQSQNGFGDQGQFQSGRGFYD